MKLPTLKAYMASSPYQRGYMAYTFSAWPGSKIPSEKKCPYRPGSKNHTAFWYGVHAAVLDAQDSES